MMKDIAIYGAGGFGREVACLINAINKQTPTWNFIGFFDDGLEIGYSNEFGAVLGGMNELNNYSHELNVVIAIGSPKWLKHISAHILNSNISFPNLIAPDVTLFDEDSLRIGKGNIITFGTMLSCNTVIADFNIINTMCGFGHDVTIGSYNAFMPRVQISGNVTIGNENFWGLNASIVQDKKVGNNNTIGACSLLLRSIKDGFLYFGVPATKQTI